MSRSDGGPEEQWMDRNDAVTALMELGILEPLATALIRHGGRCAYCGRSVVGRRLSYACVQTDHLLPRIDFPDLVTHRDNWVLSCSVCNLAKRDWIPDMMEMRGPRHVRTRNAVELLENEADRSYLIGMAKSFVHRQTKHGKWERDWREARRIVRGL